MTPTVTLFLFVANTLPLSTTGHALYAYLRTVILMYVASEVAVFSFYDIINEKFILRKKGPYMRERTLEDLNGKTILIGLTYYTHDEVLVEQQQHFGTVMEANQRHILVRLKNDEILSLPPDLRSTYPAPAGEYRLRSTGEVIKNPDFLTTWNINMAKEPDTI